MSYNSPYLDYSPSKTRKGGKGNKMPNKSTVTEAPKASTKAKYAKTRGEHYKDIVIAMLVTGIIAFIGGMHFSNTQHTAVSNAVKAVTAPSASAQAPVAPASK